MKEYKIKLELTGNFEDDWSEGLIKKFLTNVLKLQYDVKEATVTSIKETNTDNPYHIDYKRQTKLDL